MSHALNALDHALRGDPSGLSYLERTASIYVLDATTPGHPTTYGWWDFLNNALNEIERYEEGSALNNPAYASAAGVTPNNGNANPLDPHVRLLATITRRMARRPPSSDRRLIGTCLANASMTHLAVLSNPETSRALLLNNGQLRERDMGRIAAIVFDYSFHRKRTTNTVSSAFSDPVAMEMMCGVIAANAVSTGPNAVRHLVSNWIVPSFDSLPSFSVAAILNYVANESTGKGCPVGVKEVMKECVPAVFVKALGPLLVETLRESEESDESMINSGQNINHRIAAMTLRAFDSWCKASSIGAVQLRSKFGSTKINILNAIADALYSNSEPVIDAVSDLIDTILKIDSFGNTVSSGLSIAQTVLSSTLGTNTLLLAQQVSESNCKARMSILAELVSAVGLQRLRFTERQHKGDISVCRCLARTATRVLTESQDFIISGALQVSLEGLFDLLFKAVAHPSIDVCGISLEAFSGMVPRNTDLSTRLLPYLQGKAIIPFQLRNDAEGYQEFVDFRDRFLKDALVACHEGCGVFYLTSCGSAIEEFCQATLSPHLPHQLEAALFCLVAVSSEAKKATDKESLDQILSKIILALKRNAFTTTSKEFVMARMCSFISQYASNLAHSAQSSVFEMASELATSAFNLSVEQCSSNDVFPAFKHVSALSEASTALQKLLCSAPSRFSAPTAMSALENAWNMPYSGKQVVLKDRETLCEGMCVVIAALPPDQLEVSLNKLTQPIMTCLSITANGAETNSNERASILLRLANETRLLAAVVEHFSHTDAPSRYDLLSTLFQKSWQGLAVIVEKYSSEVVVANSIFELLNASLSLYRSKSDIILLQEACSLAKTITNKNPESLSSFLTFTQYVITIHGAKVQVYHKNESDEIASIRGIVKQLMILSFEGVMTFSTFKEQSNLSASRGNENIPDIMSPMFKTLSTCVTKCPIFLLSLGRDGQTAGELVLLSVQASPSALSIAEVETSLSAVKFLEDLMKQLNSFQIENIESIEREGATDLIREINILIQTDVLTSCTAGICGACPQETVAHISSLMYSILQSSQWIDVEAPITSVLGSQHKFKLGDDCKAVAIEKFKCCTEGSYPFSNFSDLVFELWDMHQTDDTEATAGGQMVHDFITKHRVQR